MHVSVRTVDRVIIQYGTNVGDRDDAGRLEVDDTTADAVLTALAQPNGGVLLHEDGRVEALAYVAPVAPPDPNDELRAAIEGATDFASLKAALLGVTRPAQVAGRPV